MKTFVFPLRNYLFLKYMKIFMVILIGALVIYCVPATRLVIPELDKPFVRYPTYRIDDKMYKIGIIGRGVVCQEI